MYSYKGFPRNFKMKRLINRKTLHAMIPLSERAIFDMEKRGEFPKRIALTSRNVAWDLDEVEAWINARKTSGTKIVRPGPLPLALTA